MQPVETLYRGLWLRLMRCGQWEYAERTNPGGGVMIVAVTPDDKILFVEQFRPALNCRTIEMPAGLVGDVEALAHERAIDAASRELEEETGYRAAHIDFLMEGATSSGMSNEIMAFVLARELTRVGPGGGDEHEDIVVHEIDRRSAPGWLVERISGGYSIDPKIFAGLYLMDHAAELFPAPR
ncbi:MAG: NUDIX hydrolase [Dokdonella sp.]